MRYSFRFYIFIAIGFSAETELYILYIVYMQTMAWRKKLNGLRPYRLCVRGHSYEMGKGKDVEIVRQNDMIPKANAFLIKMA